MSMKKKISLFLIFSCGFPVITSILAAGKVKASVEESLTGLGRSLMPALNSPPAVQIKRQLVINGIALDLRTGSSSMEPDEILNLFVESFAARDGGITRILKMTSSCHYAAKLNVLTIKNGSEMCAAAIDLGRETLDVPQLKGILESVSQGKFPGDVKYLYVQKTGGNSRYLELSIPAQTDMRHLLMDHGSMCRHYDPAGGLDDTCIFSARETGTGFFVLIYRIAPEQDALAGLHRYGVRLRNRGWIVSDDIRSESALLASSSGAGYLSASSSHAENATILTVIGRLQEEVNEHER